MKKRLAIPFFLCSVAFAASAARITAPADGAVVPLLSDGQKACLALPRAERVKSFADPQWRKAMRKLGDRPLRVKLRWEGSGRAKVRVALGGRTVLETETDRGEVELVNLEIARRYEWRVEDGAGAATASFTTEDVAPRLVELKGVPNVRDLGGRRGLGGRRVRQGLVYRSAGLNENAKPVYYTRDELAALGRLDELAAKAERHRPRLEQLLAWQADIGAFDRDDREFREWCGRHPEGTPAQFLSSRVGRERDAVAAPDRVEKGMLPGGNRLEKGKSREYFTDVLGVRTDVDLRSDRECYGMTGSPAGDKVRWVHVSSSSYGSMQKKEGRKAFAEVFRVFLDRANYPVDFHCIAGQDRTGAVAFILNALLGVEEEELYRDWEATGFWNGDAGFNHRNLFDKLVRGFDSFPGETVNARVEAYVLSLGFTAEDLARFREIMLEP